MDHLLFYFYKGCFVSPNDHEFHINYIGTFKYCKQLKKKKAEEFLINL